MRPVNAGQQKKLPLATRPNAAKLPEDQKKISCQKGIRLSRTRQMFITARKARRSRLAVPRSILNGASRIPNEGVIDHTQLTVKVVRSSKNA